jgi:hypothetical protein
MGVIGCGGAHESEIHIEASMSFGSVDSRALCGLFLNASLFFEVDKSKRVILEDSRESSSILREYIQLPNPWRP